jgi:hypothetical protein
LGSLEGIQLALAAQQKQNIPSKAREKEVTGERDLWMLQMPMM